MTNSFAWYEEDITTFLLATELPAYRKDMPMKTALEVERVQFQSRYSDMLNRNSCRKFSDSFYKILSGQQSQIDSFFRELINIICFYDNADMAAAQQAFDQMMDNLYPYLFITDIYWPNLPTTFYRVRISHNEVLKKPKDLFHIPYKKRHLVSNERYSLAGHPCLYLASQLYIAWQECDYPHSYYYSEYQYQESRSEKEAWRFITFLSPRKLATRYFVAINQPEEEYLKIAQSCVLSYPLVFACSIVNLNGNSAFKPEYVIPQMLTQWVYRHYDDIKGIKYFSCFDTDDTRVYNGFNIVMPVKNIDNRRGFSKDLIARFKLSIPEQLFTRLSEEKCAIIKQYKKDLFDTMRDTFREASDCLFDFYNIADLLDKAIRNADNSDMRLVISAVRNVIRNGERLLSDYSMTDIVDKKRAASAPSEQLDEKITSFCSIFTRFQTDIIEIAKDFDTMVDRIPSHKNEDFYSI